MLDTIKGEIRIYPREVESKKGTRVIFNGCVGSTKLEDDSYLNYYMPINFSKALKKDVAKVYEKESFDAIISEAWIKAYKDKDGNVRPILFINKATVVTEEPKKAKTKSKAKSKSKAPVEDDEDEDTDTLPF